MYEDIREQIKIGKEEKQQILIIGSFAKIGVAEANIAYYLEKYR